MASFLRLVRWLMLVFFAGGNPHLVVDEAHGAGLHRPRSHGMVTVLGLEGRVLVRLYAFNKALAASGGTFLSSGSLQYSRFTITADAYRAHYQYCKCLRFLSTSLLFTRNVSRGQMITAVSSFPPSSLVHALRTIGHVQHQSVPSPNTLLPLAYKYRATASMTSLPGIASC